MSVDPTTLNLSTPSPSPSTTSEPSAKRRRTTDMTTDERKEARAHRNRIAAQNSRDRRKAHYATLDQRIADLEAENQRLRDQSPSGETARENAELRERVKTLENGWQTVLTALANQGLQLPSLPAPVSTTSASLPTVTLPLSPALTHESPQSLASNDFATPSPLAFAPSPLDMTEAEPQSNLFADSTTTSDATCPPAAGSVSIPVDATSTLFGARFGSDNTGPFGFTSNEKAVENFLSQILVNPSETSGSPSAQDPSLLGTEATDASLSEQLMSASSAGDLGMQWSAAEPMKTEPGALGFEIPLDLSVTFDWPTFDAASANTSTLESNDEMQRLLDQYTWNSIQV